MKRSKRIAIVGSGASAIYLLKRLLDAAETLAAEIGEITVFEKGRHIGMGMPYNPDTTDRYNMSNISSEELPDLDTPFADWLRAQDAEQLETLGVRPAEISESGIYTRLALGAYLQAQYRAIAVRLAAAGLPTHERPNCEIVDAIDEPETESVTLVTQSGERERFDRVIIATGHAWAEKDNPQSGFYASPWPIQKLLPPEGQRYDFPIGTLGASLSAFDVVASLSHRHGAFVQEGDQLVFRATDDAGNFKIVLHSAHGWLPHLQYEQRKPMREIYRQIDRDGILALRDRDGWLRLGAYFDAVCRPALLEAMERDGRSDIATALRDANYTLRDFVEQMTAEHGYDNAFEGMRQERAVARRLEKADRPMHWKETLDDLMYTLNYHAELLPAEDHIELRKTVMPFLMNVIAAMPLVSADTLLALYDARRLEIVSGRVEIDGKSAQKGRTQISINDEGQRSTESYRMFVDCSGQKPLELDEFAFPTLVGQGVVRSARSRFAEPQRAEDALSEDQKERLIEDQNGLAYAIGGIDIDAFSRVIGTNGKPSPRIHDIAYPHTTGVRPYSYGLQACDDTAAILVRAWVAELETGRSPSKAPEETTRIYEETQEADLADAE